MPAHYNDYSQAIMPNYNNIRRSNTNGRKFQTAILLSGEAYGHFCLCALGETLSKAVLQAGSPDCICDMMKMDDWDITGSDRAIMRAGDICDRVAAGGDIRTKLYCRMALIAIVTRLDIVDALNMASDDALIALLNNTYGANWHFALDGMQQPHALLWPWDGAGVLEMYRMRNSTATALDFVLTYGDGERRIRLPSGCGLNVLRVKGSADVVCVKGNIAYGNVRRQAYRYKDALIGVNNGVEQRASDGSPFRDFAMDSAGYIHQLYATTLTLRGAMAQYAQINAPDASNALMIACCGEYIAVLMNDGAIHSNAAALDRVKASALVETDQYGLCALTVGGGVLRADGKARPCPDAKELLEIMLGRFAAGDESAAESIRRGRRRYTLMTNGSLTIAPCPDG